MYFAMCRICFTKNIRMYEIKKTSYQDIFEKHTGRKLITGKGKPNKVCYLCNLQLQKFSRFIEISQRAEKYLSELNCSRTEISQELPYNKVHNLSISPVKCTIVTETTEEIEIPGENKDDLEMIIISEKNDNYHNTKADVKFESISQEQPFKKIHNLSSTIVTENTIDLVEIEILGENEEDDMEIKMNSEKNYNYHNTHVDVKIESVGLDYAENPNYEDIVTEDTPFTLRYDEDSDDDVKDITIHEMILEDTTKHLSEPRTDLLEPETDVLEPRTDLLEPEIDVLEPRTDLLEPRADLLEPRADHLKYTKENHSSITQKYLLPIVSVTLERIPDKIISLRTAKNGRNKKEKVISNYNCEQCYFRSRYKHVLQKHMHVHDKTREFSCQTCLYRFRTLSSLINHSYKVHKTHIKCKICKTEFTKQLYLKRHMMKVHDAQTHPCDICDKKYKHRSAYLVHMRTHTGEKPFGCKWCHKKFNDKSNCRKHMKSHTQGPYVCFMCDKMFDVDSQLREHVSEHIM